MSSDGGSTSSCCVTRTTFGEAASLSGTTVMFPERGACPGLSATTTVNPPSRSVTVIHPRATSSTSVLHISPSPSVVTFTSCAGAFSGSKVSAAGSTVSE